MDLTIVIGASEYLRPIALSAAEASFVARSLAPGALVDELAWAPNDGAPYLDVWLDCETEERRHRIDLALDYLRETSVAGDARVLFLPVVSAFGDPSSDRRVIELVGAAQRKLSGGRLRCVRWSLSRRSDATLRTVARISAERAERPATVLGLSVETLYVGEGSLSEPPAALTANYNRALLRAAEARLAPGSVFGTRGRAERVAELLEAQGLYVRADAPTEEVVAELAPGGDLHGLLTRPRPG
ncbi:hypothetical protein [Sandaracinus amylolyticus]|uniref:hypothetical protein n=1 Tax=Sandaracinus amylolyticus TaxID=927083 RepID=UPI001F3E38BF|nr:hypothetical protein [Sandaracinus amylolyticus]UJR86884.1 Hypothetical protein I5071_89850 [Sandaracinus amylolyticus]